MESILKDIRFSARSLLKRPGFTLIVVLTLALGIGANAAVFSVINAVLLRPLPYREADRVVMIWQNNIKAGIADNGVSPANFIDWSEQSNSFEAMAGTEPFGFSMVGDGEPERFSASLVTSGFFQVAGTDALIGRTLTKEDFQPGNERVVVLGHGLWQRRFGGDTSVVGRKLTLNGQPYVVAGVMPPEFQLPPDREIWAPRVLGEAQRQNRGATYWTVVGRLKQGTTVHQAQEEMNGIAARLAVQYPDTNGEMGANVVPFFEQLTGQIQSALWILAGAVGFVLLIACVNVANLLLVRGAERQREFAIRRALGAARLRLLRQTLTESLLLVLLGSVTGILVASWLVKLIPSLSSAKLPRLEYVSMDLRVVLFACGVSVLTAVVFGLVPAIQFWRNDIQSTLKESGRSAGAATPARQRLRQALVISEIAIAVVLLTGAGLLVRSFVRLMQVDPGFTKENVLALQVFLSRNYQQRDQQMGFYEQSLEKISALPGIKAAAVIAAPPYIDLELDAPFNIVGRPAPPPGSEEVAFYSAVSSEYLNALNIPLKQGRFFTKFDGPSSQRVVVITEAMARRYFPNENPLGQRLVVMFGEAETREIVGVVGDILHSGLHTQARPQMFVPHQQSPSSYMTFLVKTTTEPGSQLNAVKRAIREVNPNQAFARTATMEELVSDSLKQRRFNLFLLGLFAVIALLLATIGIYGSISYSTRQRTNEIGVRIALGAQSRDVLRLIVGQGLGLGLVGVVIGLGAAFLLTRVIKSLLFGVSPTDPLTFIAISVLLLFTALVASLIPARRATKVDPLVALRSE
ncbi:MAG TPA: ABC transporter permease [Pyrinomonadaceae bacterium]|nr:ABC transporter permease [Pyrinomonadaceae bacterium]